MTDAEVANISATVQAAVSGNISSPGASASPIDNGTGADAAGAPGSSDSASSDDGDDEGGDDAATGSTGAGVRANVLIDTASLAGSTAQPDAMVTSTGNSSLWIGADGINNDGGGLSPPATVTNPGTGGGGDK